MSEQYGEVERPAYSRDALEESRQMERDNLGVAWDRNNYPGGPEQWDAIMSGSLEDYANVWGYDIRD